MLVKIFQKTEDQVFVFDEKDNLLKNFEIKENLQRALEFLKRLNSVKTINGIPVYRTKMFEGKSVWSFHQHVVFWNFLREYVKHEEIIKFLLDNKIEKAMITDDSENLKRYLKINGIEVVNDSLWAQKIRAFFVSLFMKVIALKITLLALLKALISQSTILIYTPDKFSKKHNCDFRFYSVYQYLKEKRLGFVEIFHTLLNRELLQNIWTRKRLALYQEVFPIFSTKSGGNQNYDLSCFEPHNQKYFKHLLKIIDKESENSIGRIKALTWLLKFTKIKTLLAIDDLRCINELIVACKLNKIKTYGFQHGNFIKYQVGWMNYLIPKELSVTFDKLFAWNNYWKKVLLSYSTQYDENNVEVSGLLRELERMNFKEKKSKIEKLSDSKILVPYEAQAPKREVGNFLNRFIDLGIKIFFKARPDLSIKYQFDQYNIKHKEKVEVIQDINEDILSEVDAVAGNYSTFLNEMIFYEKPVFIFKTSFDFGHQLVDDNLGMLIKKDFNPSELLDYINNCDTKVIKEKVWPKENITLKKTLDSLGLKK